MSTGPPRSKVQTTCEGFVALLRIFKAADAIPPLHREGVLLVPVPIARTATMQNRALSVVGPVVWNGFPLELPLFHGTLTEALFIRLKTVLFGRAGVWSASD